MPQTAAVESVSERAGVGRRLWHRLTWQRVAVKQMRLLEPVRELRWLLAYAVVFVAWSACTGWLIRRHPMPIAGAAYFTNDYQYIFLFKIPGLLLIPALWFARAGYRAKDLLPRWRWERRTVLLMLFAFLAGVQVNGSYVGNIRAVIDSGAPHLALGFAIGIVLPLISAGLPEEFVFRGLLQTRLEAVHGRAIAIVGTAVLFTAWHLPTRFMLASGGEGQAGSVGSVLLHTGLPVLVVALILSVLWDRYRRLIPLIALHWGIDLLPAVAGMFGILR
jgi:membrane protease YdiL (CAAX protease family)